MKQAAEDKKKLPQKAALSAWTKAFPLEKPVSEPQSVSKEQIQTSREPALTQGFWGRC